MGFWKVCNELFCSKIKDIPIVHFNNYDSYRGMLFSCFMFLGKNSYFPTLFSFFPGRRMTTGRSLRLSYPLTLPQEPSGYNSGTSSTQALALLIPLSGTCFFYTSNSPTSKSSLKCCLLSKAYQDHSIQNHILFTFPSPISLFCFP